MSCRAHPSQEPRAWPSPGTHKSQYLVFDTVVTARAHKEVQSIQLPVLSCPVKCCPSQLTGEEKRVNLPCPAHLASVSPTTRGLRWPLLPQILSPPLTLHTLSGKSRPNFLLKSSWAPCCLLNKGQSTEAGGRDLCDGPQQPLWPLRPSLIHLNSCTMGLFYP